MSILSDVYFFPWPDGANDRAMTSRLCGGSVDRFRPALLDPVGIFLANGGNRKCPLRRASANCDEGSIGGKSVDPTSGLPFAGVSRGSSRGSAISGDKHLIAAAQALARLRMHVFMAVQS
jgi:hypothetical protein